MKTQNLTYAKTAAYFSERFGTKIGIYTICRLKKKMDTFDHITPVESDERKYLPRTVPVQRSLNQTNYYH